MFFLLAFGWHVAASFAFVLAILSPNWIAVQLQPTSANVRLQRGVFYVCDLLGKNTTYESTQCASVIGVNETMNSTSRWDYKLATASASIAIGCAGLSVIILWLAGIYFNVYRKKSCRLCLLIFMAILLFFTFCASCAVWILLIVETLVLGYRVDRSILRWPMWLAVGASGGFLMAFVSTLVHFCTGICRRRKPATHKKFELKTEHF